MSSGSFMYCACICTDKIPGTLKNLSLVINRMNSQTGKPNSCILLKQESTELIMQRVLLQSAIMQPTMALFCVSVYVLAGQINQNSSHKHL